MKTREELIALEMNYCQHYTRGKGADMVCAAGVSPLPRVAVGKQQIKWGPCIAGHLLENPLSVCPHWLRRTREQGEKRADAIESSMKRMELVYPVLLQWRDWSEQNKVSKQGVIECPVCKGKLHLSQAAYNGHVWGKCETKGCVSWME